MRGIEPVGFISFGNSNLLTLKKYYVYINKINIDNTADVFIYSIDAPLIPLQSIVVQPPTKKKFGYLFLIGILFLIGAILYYLYQRRKKVIVDLKIDDSGNIIEEVFDEETIPYLSIPKNIYLFGLFKIVDNEGVDISAEFSPTLRSLLILLITYTYHDKGISGKEMLRLLWPDKDDNLSKNSRNVYISKLRTLLKKIGDIEIINKNSMWSIEISDEIKCDYIDALSYNKLSETTQLIDEDINEILNILSRGVLLPDFELDWLDNYKNAFSNQIIDMLYRLLKIKTLSNTMQYKICDILLQIDYLNEPALFYKCKILYNEGKKGIAKNIYDSFCIEYQNSLGLPYAISFINVCKMKPEF